MASWKKVIVSGSQAHLAGVTASNLPTKTASDIVGVSANGEFFRTSVSALGAYTWYVSSSADNDGVASGSSVIFQAANGLSVSQSAESSGIKLTYGISSINSSLLSVNTWYLGAGDGTEQFGSVALGNTASVNLDYTGSDNFMHISDAVTSAYDSDYIILDYLGEGGLGTPTVKKITVDNFLASQGVYTGSTPIQSFDVASDQGTGFSITDQDTLSIVGDTSTGIITSGSATAENVTVIFNTDTRPIGTALNATQDYFPYSDNGVEQRITAGNVAGFVSSSMGGKSVRINASAGLTGTSLASLDLGATGSIVIDYTTANNVVLSAGSGSIVADDQIIFNDTSAPNGVRRTDVTSLVKAGANANGLLSSSQAIFTVSGSGGTQVINQGDTLKVQGTVNEVEVTVSATDTVTVGLPNDVVVTNNLTVGGNLTVEGTTTVLETENLLVEDRFILLASGSSTGVDGGIVVQNNSAGSGNAYFYDSTANRWSFNTSVLQTATSATVEEYVVSVSGSADQDPPALPAKFGTSAATRVGLMHVNQATGDVWIYS